MAVDGEVGGDGHHPALGPVPQAGPPQVGAGQRLLGHVLGVAPVPEDPERHPVGQAIEVGEGLLESHPPRPTASPFLDPVLWVYQFPRPGAEGGWQTGSATRGTPAIRASNSEPMAATISAAGTVSRQSESLTGPEIGAVGVAAGPRPRAAVPGWRC